MKRWLALALIGVARVALIVLILPFVVVYLLVRLFEYAEDAAQRIK